MLWAFAEAANSSAHFRTKATQVLLRLGLPADVEIRDRLANATNPTDDEFANLLNDYYKATAGELGLRLRTSVGSTKTDFADLTEFSDGSPEGGAAPTIETPGIIKGEGASVDTLLSAASWAVLTSRSEPEAVASYLALKNALLRVGQPEKAARAIKAIHDIRPDDADVVASFSGVMRALGKPFADAPLLEALRSETPLSRAELLAIAIGHADYALAWASLEPPQSGSVQIKECSPVTQQRLNNPEPGSWLLYRHSYNGQGFSPLKQINSKNVTALTPAWTFSTGMIGELEAPPMVNSGLMFVSTSGGQVLALNAKTGNLIWRYKHEVPEDLFQLHPATHGVGMWQDKLFLATTDGHLIALNAKSGKEIWNRKVQANQNGWYMSMEPLVANGKVMVGGWVDPDPARGGYVAAFDADAGKQLWLTYTTPSFPAEPGDDPVGITGTYDPDRNLTYWNFRTARPWSGDQNLYAGSRVGLTLDTGMVVDHHQYSRDPWDYDTIDPPILVKVGHDGQASDWSFRSGRDGYLWVHGLDPETRDLDRQPIKSVSSCPPLWSDKSWAAASYNPDTQLMYIPVNKIDMCATLEDQKNRFSLRDQLPSDNHISELQARDPATGKVAWTYPFPKNQQFGSTLTTAGNLVFTGGTNDQTFRAFDAETGKLLWEHKTNSSTAGMPVAYEVDGTEYIAIQSGWRGGDIWKTDATRQGGAVWVFGLSPQSGDGRADPDHQIAKKQPTQGTPAGFEPTKSGSSPMQGAPAEKYGSSAATQGAPVGFEPKEYGSSAKEQ